MACKHSPLPNDPPSPADQDQPAALSARNLAFSDFLQITERDRSRIQHHAPALGREATAFSRRFYDYLLQFEPTARILREYEKGGGSIADLVDRQRDHLMQLLSANTDDASAAHLNRIGRIHAEREIEPAWVMGAYRLYLQHMLEEIATAIPQPAQIPLNESLIKLVFRDLGLLLDGYWDGIADELARSRHQNHRLQSQLNNLLQNLPQRLWSVDVAHDTVILSNAAAQEAGFDPAAHYPIPGLTGFAAPVRESMEAAWARALTGAVAEGHVEAGETRRRTGTTLYFRFMPEWEQGHVSRIDGLIEHRPGPG